MARLELFLLGTFRTSLDGRPLVHFSSDKVRALLAYLSVESSRPHSRSVLAALLWPDWPQQVAQNYLRNALSDLRGLLGDRQSALPFLLVTHEAIQFNTNSDYWLDMIEFQKQSSPAGSQAGNPNPDQFAEIPSCYERAVDLYRGEFLEGLSVNSVAFEEWALLKRGQMREQMLEVLYYLTENYLARGEYARARQTARRQVEMEPWLEEAHRQLMHTLALSGQRSAALKHYENCRRILAYELNTEPDEETTQLVERIRRGEIGPPPIAAPRLDNLPAEVTSFIGREKEIEFITSLIHDLAGVSGVSRLVTLTGAGGVGKSRLALKVAEGLRDHFSHGVWLVELASLDDPEMLPLAVAQALGVALKSGAVLDGLVDFLSEKHLLLVLDNCEHLIAACSSLAGRLLQNCPGLYLLATSREILGISGEMPFRVPSLSTPDPQHLPGVEEVAQYEAVRLFVERAKVVSPSFVLNEANTASLAYICGWLDGIPLAIELAAARLRMMTIDQVAARLEQSFKILTGGSRASLPRHQTLKALIDWSYNLLSESEKLLLMRLSVFAGVFSLEAAETVCADEHLRSVDIIDLLAHLVDKSLVNLELRAYGGRYRMLETIRQYAHERLLEENGENTMRSRHLAYYTWLADQAEPQLRARDQDMWMDRLEDELDNLRLALEWSLEGRFEDGMRLAADLIYFWHIRNHAVEAQDWLWKLLTVEADQRAGNGLSSECGLQRARAQRALIYLVVLYGSVFPQAKLTAMAEESVNYLRRLVPENRYELAISLFCCQLYLDQKELNHILMECLSIFRQEKSLFYSSEVLFYLAGPQFYQGEIENARVYFEESLAICREIVDLDGIIGRLARVADCAVYQGDYAKADELYQECCEYASKSKNLFVKSVIQQFSGALAQGNYAAAIMQAEQILAYYQDIRESDGISRSLGYLAKVAWSRGDFDQAEKLCNDALALNAKPVLYGIFDVDPEYILGRIALSRGEVARAEMWFQTILSGKGSFMYPIYTTLVLDALAVLSTTQGQMRRAAILFGAADKIFNRLAPGLSPRERDEHEIGLAEVRSALGDEVFAREFNAGQAMSEEQVMQCALNYDV